MIITQTAIIMVAMIKESGRILSDYYARVGKETGMWPSLKALTSDTVECDRILVSKTK